MKFFIANNPNAFTPSLGPLNTSMGLGNGKTTAKWDEPRQVRDGTGRWILAIPPVEFWVSPAMQSWTQADYDEAWFPEIIPG